MHEEKAMRKGLILTAGGAALALAACVTPGPRPLTLTATLTGYQAVPGPGDLDGTGTAQVRLDPQGGRVCWTLAARGIDPATAAHIHRGEAGAVGPPVVPLTPPVPERSEGCAAADAALLAEMRERPHAFYVNIHNAAFPQSAIRGQLRGEVRRSEGQPRR
jgi:hypothetical protein